MSKPATTRRMTEVEGVIFPDAIYDTEAVMRACGIGRVRLMELRTSGRLTVGKAGGDGRAWYRGRDIIDLIFAGEGREAGRKAS